KKNPYATARNFTMILGMIVAISVMPTLPVFAWQDSFSGRAIGASVTSPIVNLNLADTGQLPSQGGEIDATVLHVSNQLVTGDVLLSVTMGFEDTAQSTAATSDLTLLPNSSNQITADFVRADSQATCTGATGSSAITNLKVGGQPVTISGSPNQMISVPGVFTLVINEQTSSSDGTNNITVKALDLKLATGEQVIVSSAHSDISCGSSQTVTKDFMTGGGYIIVNNDHANFGFVSGFKPGQSTPSGQLNYIDHSTGMHVKSIDITSYSGSGNTRTFSGNAQINGVSGYTFTVTAADDDSGGKDRFSIQLSNGYNASGDLKGGNIELHT
ncbi:choice-of-anchor P family protein, partial [Candidatus Nitrosotalea sp. FS]|uniref:choice-of-anchor P family protein n=1 Tax=Candidatus Nitrosotalea sp. FS TaxID=2341021 RepID=UPI002714DEFE